MRGDEPAALLPSEAAPGPALSSVGPPGRLAAAAGPRPVQIAGGGLAGLALGLALRCRGVPVVVYEAGQYPCHRVCGEFISGLQAEEIGALALDGELAAAPRHQTTAWFRGDRLLFERALPEPALAISRFELDAMMARRFVALGGDLHCGQRIEPRHEDGWIRAAGRARRPGRWLGLKAHFTGLPLRAGLEMHLGRGGYAGLTQLAGGRVNVCALLPAGEAADASQSGPAHRGSSDKSSLLALRVEAIGLRALSDRLRAADCDRASVTGVTRFSFGWHDAGRSSPALGDQLAVIPPFTGHGMTMALQGALTVAPIFDEWSRGTLDWRTAQVLAQRALRRRFAKRLRWAAALHPFLLRPGGQAVAEVLTRVRLLPFGWLFHRVR